MRPLHAGGHAGTILTESFKTVGMMNLIDLALARLDFLSSGLVMEGTPIIWGFTCIHTCQH